MTRGYLYISILILAAILIPFYISFEKDRPYARQIVLVAVMTALAVASRAAFFWVPQFKPVIAVIIIAGIAMGAKSGFVVGSMTAFVSNFLFGQGPWTPFQMVAWGIIGMLAGLLFNRKYMLLQQYGAEQDAEQSLKQSTLHETGRKANLMPVMIYGAISCFVIHGAITDIWTLLSISDQPTFGELITVYSAGLIPDLVLAAATVIFLAVAADPMLKKLRRMQAKYGMITE